MSNLIEIYIEDSEELAVLEALVEEFHTVVDEVQQLAWDEGVEFLVHTLHGDVQMEVYTPEQIEDYVPAIIERNVMYA